MPRLRTYLKSLPIKRAINAWIVPAVIKKYHVLALRALWNSESDAETYIWGKRREMELLMENMEPVACFFSCITMMPYRAKKRKRRSNDDGDGDDDDDDGDETQEDSENIPKARPGIAFWICFSCADFAADEFMNTACRSFLQAEFDLETCKVIKPKGKKYMFEYHTPVIWNPSYFDSLQ